MSVTGINTATLFWLPAYNSFHLSVSRSPVPLIKLAFATFIQMENLIFCLIVQLNLIFGIAGLVWPDRFMRLYGVLMFPWPASHRAIRTHGIVAIAGYVMVLAKLVLSA